MITTSKQFSLNWRDLLKGFLVAVITAALTLIQNSLEAGSFHFDWKNIAVVATSTAIAYLLKNFFSESVIQVPVSDAPDSIKPDGTK